MALWHGERVVLEVDSHRLPQSVRSAPRLKTKYAHAQGAVENNEFGALASSYCGYCKLSHGDFLRAVNKQAAA